MKYAKRLVSLFLLLSITAGSTIALAAENVQITASDVAAEDTAAVQNTNLKIKLTYPSIDESSGILIQTNFQKPTNSAETPVLYRSTNNGKFKSLPSGSRQVFYSYFNLSTHSDDGPLKIEDDTCKNGRFYRYKLTTVITNPSTGKSSVVAYSKVKSRYYLYSMTYGLLDYKRSVKKKTITLSWKNQYNSKADGYQLRYYHELKNGQHSKVVTRTIKNKHTTKYVLKNCISNQRYFAQLRSYKKYKGTTYYSNWSEDRIINRATLN